MEDKFDGLIDKEDKKLNVILNAYQVLRNNIEFYKRQQWQVSYYSIVVNAALSYFYLEKSGDYSGLKCPVIALGFVASIICIIIIESLEHSIKSEVNSVGRIETAIPLLRSITSAKCTALNVQKHIKHDSYIFFTSKKCDCDYAHSSRVFALSIITVLISLGFLLWVLSINKANCV